MLSGALMESRGNVYQRLIFAAQDYLGRNGQLPADLAEFAQFAGIGEDEVGDVFQSPEDLHEGMIYHGVTLLNDALRAGAVSSTTSDPIVQLRAIAHGYLVWADRNPALFRLLVAALNGPIKPDSTLHRYTSSMRDLYRRKLVEAQRLGILAEETDIELATMMLHCLVKGGNMIFMTRATDPWFAQDDRSTPELAERIFGMFMDNLVQANAPARHQAKARKSG
ncbi:hypothetical protein [Paracoccus sp. TOH]|uniref:hypothetical protein n=1 Tax=Paracoccus sp. TOH TaxID=1263728 RepID=UPI0002175811|nr:hypothetical protein [Paracoccus sp. TOH]WJS85874.1 hypothetical protein NBE95_10665 [Paracoccus sp. TOH]